MTIISSIDDLRIYLGSTYDLSRDEATLAANTISCRTRSRPSYGDDWSAFLEALTEEDVYEMASTSCGVQTPTTMVNLSQNLTAYVIDGQLYFGAKRVEAIELLDQIFPGAEWPRDRDGRPMCATGIKVGEPVKLEQPDPFLDDGNG